MTPTKIVWYQNGSCEKYSKNNFIFSIALGSSENTAHDNNAMGAESKIKMNSSFQSDCLASNNLPWYSACP
jgi:hypothetical protein